MQIHNMMTCSGWGETNFMGGCALSWLSLVIVIFLGLILRRQCEDGILSGTGFNVVGSLGAGVLLHVILIALTGDSRFALIGGIIGVIAGGYLAGMFLDGDGGY